MMKSCWLLLAGMLVGGCDYSLKSDYNVTKEYDDFVAKLNEKPKVAKAKVSVADAQLELGKQKFETFCVACHGIDGKANGPAALAMQPRPRNLTDKNWQKSVDDARLRKVLKEGGQSVGLSATRASWGGVLSDDDIVAVVKYVRQFGK